MITFLIVITFLSINILSYYIGQQATEGKYNIPTISNNKLNFKPFNCRPCFTFWTTLILQSIIGILLSSITYIVVGIIFAFLLFFQLKLIERIEITK